MYNPEIGDMYYCERGNFHIAVIERDRYCKSWWNCFALEYQYLIRYASSDLRHFQKVA